MSLWANIKNRLMKVGAGTGMAQEYNDIFDLTGVPAYRQFYNFGIFVWKYLYRGLYQAWHIIPAPTVDNPSHKRELYRSNTPKAVCAELASLAWSERCKINVTVPRFPLTEDDPEGKAQRFIDCVLKDNGFYTKMQSSIEIMLALGGFASKVWYDGSRLQVGYAAADQFVPIAWDNAKITEGVFISRQAKGGYYYTRLEWHKWDGAAYVITNELFRAEQKNQNHESQDILGYRYPLAEIFPALNEETRIEGLKRSLFTYARTPIANNIDFDSPLGVSIYANALETLHAIDIAFDSFVAEFRLGKRRIIVPASAIRTVVDPVTGTPRRYFDATDEVYQALSTDDPDHLKINDNSVPIRVQEHIEGINALLSLLCLQLGFSANTFTFDEHQGIKTATEVISEDSKTYKTVKNIQSAIEPSLIDLVKNIFSVASVYDVEFEGEKVSSWFPSGDIDADISVYWDDSIIEDKKSQIDRGILLMSNGVMSKRAFMRDVLGMTDEQVDAELKEIADEGQIRAEDVDRFATFGVS